MKEVVVTRFSPVEGGHRASTLYGNMGNSDHRFDGSGVELDLIPWPLPGIFRNLRVDADNQPGVHTWIFTLYKNGVATALTVTLTGTTVTATDTTHDITIVPGDELAMRADVTDTSTFFSWSWEFESETPGESGYGGFLGDFGFGSELGSAAFGNNASGASSINGSIASCDGNLTGLRVRTLTAPGMGETYTFWVFVDGVKQDGSGGTVDTSLVLTDTDVVGNNTFTLPIVGGNIIKVGVAKSAGAPSSSNHLAYGIIFDATTPGQFHTCGSRTDSTVANPLAFWGGQSSGTESLVPGYVGPSGLVLTGMRIYGPDVNYVLRFNRTNPANQPALTTSGGVGSDLDPDHFIVYDEGDIIDILATGVIGGNTLNWGFLTFVPTQSIIVTKVTDPTGSTQSFHFTAGGGLSPTEFDLLDGESQAYEGIAAQSGYSIAEDLLGGLWTTTYVVSNDSPIDNITVGVNETVTVTVTNTLAPPPVHQKKSFKRWALQRFDIKIRPEEKA